MSFFERLKAEASAEWRAYTEYPFTNGMADGSLPEAASTRTALMAAAACHENEGPSRRAVLEIDQRDHRRAATLDRIVWPSPQQRRRRFAGPPSRSTLERPTLPL
jgi:hypothetical protein